MQEKLAKICSKSAQVCAKEKGCKKYAVIYFELIAIKRFVAFDSYYSNLF